VPHKPSPAPRQFKVGDRVKVSMHGGKVVDAVIKAAIDRTDGLHFQIDFRNERTALDVLRQLSDVHFPTGRLFIQRPTKRLHLVEPHSDPNGIRGPVRQYFCLEVLSGNIQ
jgi:hypothetical protein